MSQALKTREIIHILVSASLTLALLIAVFSESSFPDMVRISSSIRGSYFFAFLICSFTGLLLRAFRYSLLLKSLQEDTPCFWKVLLVTGVRNAFVDFLPARLGETAYIYFMNRIGVTVAAGVATFGLGIVLDLLALIFVAAFFAGVEGAITGGAPSLLMLIVFALAFFAGLALLRYLPELISSAGRIVRTLPRTAEFIRAVGSDVQRINLSASITILLLVTVMLRIAKYGGLYLLALSVLAGWNIGPDSLSPVKALGIFILSEASASLPVSGLMGFGVYEGVWSVLFHTACGSPCAALPAATIAFTVHLISQIAGYSVGIVCLAGLALVISKRRAKTSTLILFCLATLAPAAFAQEPAFVLRNPFNLTGVIAFSAEYEGRTNIYIAHMSEGTVKAAGPDGADNSYPSFSPDGKWIVFSRGKEGARSIAISRTDGSGYREIAPNDVNSDNPAWSADGRSIVFYREKKGEPKTSNLFLGFPDEPGKLVQLTKYKGRNTTPQWAPDGKHIAFSTDRFWPGWDVCILDIGSGKEDCALHGITTFCRPRYDHSGRRLAYSSGAFEDVDIFIRDMESGEDSKVTDLSGRDYDAAWSPDDAYIAFTNNGSDSRQFALFVVRIRDWQTRQILDTPASVRFLSWSAGERQSPSKN